MWRMCWELVRHGECAGSWFATVISFFEISRVLHIIWSGLWDEARTPRDRRADGALA